MKRTLSLLVAVMLVTGSAAAQDAKTPELSTLSSINVAMPVFAQWHDYLDKSGVYHADFIDPNNEFRCEVTSMIESDPHNMIYDSINSFTIVCSKPHKVSTQGKEGEK